jgi:hypothetical protein
MKFTKLSEMVKAGNQGRAKIPTECHYSWHKQTKPKGRYSFILTIGINTLKKARYRDGDNCEIEIGENEMLITLGENLPWALNSRNKTCTSKSIKISSAGIESLQAVLPKRDKAFELNVVSIETAKIRIAIPKN